MVKTSLVACNAGFLSHCRSARLAVSSCNAMHDCCTVMDNDNNNDNVRQGRLTAELTSPTIKCNTTKYNKITRPTYNRWDRPSRKICRTDKF